MVRFRIFYSNDSLLCSMVVLSGFMFLRCWPIVRVCVHARICEHERPGTHHSQGFSLSVLTYWSASSCQVEWVNNWRHASLYQNKKLLHCVFSCFGPRKSSPGLGGYLQIQRRPNGQRSPAYLPKQVYVALVCLPFCCCHRVGFHMCSPNSQWFRFAWANSHFGELVLRLADEKPHLIFKQ